MKALVYLTLLLLVSCTDYSHLAKDAMGLSVKNIEMDIDHASAIDWTVGKRKEATVTQSFIFIVDMPKLKEEDLEYLSKHKGINAWILRLIVQRGSNQQDLGSLYTPFKSQRVTRGVGKSGVASSVTLKVYYAAAYASERFRRFKCPPFNHNKKITSLDIRGENLPFDITIGQRNSYAEKSQLVSLAPSSFNGGHSLKGQYFVEIAPYNYEKKKIYSSFKRIPVSLLVVGEESINVSSCAGEHPELI